MSRLENHAMLRDAASNVFNLQHLLGLSCSHEGQIHSSGSSSFFAQRLKGESRGLILLGNF